jgi:hypothetical protein
MTPNTKLNFIKTLHTIIWLFFNVVIFYLLYAVVRNKIDKWLWAGISLVFIEGIILLACKMSCPLTVLARKYADSSKDNFDIFLPNWLAKYTKLIYTSLFIIILAMLLYRLIFIG